MIAFSPPRDFLVVEAFLEAFPEAFPVSII
jgi:hypothetical protein